jgi:hypothetical protein
MHSKFRHLSFELSKQKTKYILLSPMRMQGMFLQECLTICEGVFSEACEQKRLIRKRWRFSPVTFMSPKKMTFCSQDKTKKVIVLFIDKKRRQYRQKEDERQKTRMYQNKGFLSRRRTKKPLTRGVRTVSTVNTWEKKVEGGYCSFLSHDFILHLFFSSQNMHTLFSWVIHFLV